MDQPSLSPQSSFGPYRILSLLGQGRYSEIYLVEKASRRSALKRNKPHYQYDREVYQILDREAEILKSLKGSPYFPEYYDSGTIEDWHFLEMESIDGLSLGELMERKKSRLAPELAALLALEVARGLHILHGLEGKNGGTVHGDIKLENIMVDTQGRVKILDLGLSGVTFRYMPLERLHDKKVTPYSDIYALGQILYELIHGKRLFEKATRVETYVKMRELRIEESLFREDCPPALKKILLRCLKQDAEDRFQSAADLEGALSSYLQSQVSQVDRSNISSLVWKFLRPQIEIKAIGRFLDLDEEGYLVKAASADKIVEPWKAAVEDLRRTYVERLGPSLHSIYLRGSVARGDAISGISDIDTFAVCQGPKEKISRAWAPGYHRLFAEKFPFANGLDIQFIHIDDLFRGLSHFSYRFIIKVLATCIHGPDLAERIHKIKPALSIAFFYHGNLREVLMESIKMLNGAQDEDQIRLWSNYALRRILRLGFAINIEKEKAYTRDLYPCYQVFSKYYPEHEADMRRALELTLNPPRGKEEIVPFLDRFGGWLVLESERIFANRPPA